MFFDLFKFLLFSMSDSLPATEDTRSDADCTEIINTNNDTIEVAADADYSEGDFVIWGPYCGLCLADVVTGAEMSLRVKDGIGVLSSQVADGADFSTPGQEVWYDPTTDTFDSAESAGMYGVGPLGEAQDADGVIAFYKRRYWVEGEDT